MQIFSKTRITLITILFVTLFNLGESIAQEKVVWMSDSQYFQENKKFLSVTYSFINVNLVKAVGLIGKPTNEMLDKFQSITNDAISGASKAGPKGALASIIKGQGLELGLIAINDYFQTPQHLANEVGSVAIADGIKALNENYDLYQMGISSLSTSQKRKFRENQVKVDALGEAKKLYNISKADRDKSFEFEEAFNAVGELEQLFTKSKYFNEAVFIAKIAEILKRSNIPVDHYIPFNNYTSQLNLISRKNYIVLKSDPKSLDMKGNMLLDYLKSHNDDIQNFCGLNQKMINYTFENGEGVLFKKNKRPDKNEWLNKLNKSSEKSFTECKKVKNVIQSFFKNNGLELDSLKYIKHGFRQDRMDSNGLIIGYDSGVSYLYRVSNDLDIVINARDMLVINGEGYFPFGLRISGLTYKDNSYSINENGTLQDQSNGKKHTGLKSLGYTNQVSTRCSDIKKGIHLKAFFGEKSGFENGWGFYNAYEKIKALNIPIALCEKNEGIIGPFDSKRDADIAFQQLEDLSLLHFYIVKYYENENENEHTYIKPETLTKKKALSIYSNPPVIILDGKQDFYDTGLTALNSSQLVISLWFKSQGTNKNKMLIGNDGNDRFQMLFNTDSNSSFRIYGKKDNKILFDYNAMAGNIVNDNEWHHVIVALDMEKEELNFFLDGSQSRTMRTKSSNGVLNNLSNSLYLGANNRGNIPSKSNGKTITHNFKGMIKDVQILK